MSDVEPFCFPVCAACREAVCPMAVKPKKERAQHIATWANMTPELLRCGCREEIPAVWDFGKMLVHCSRHGWQPVRKKVVKGKVIETNPDQGMLEDIPPF